MNEFNAQLTVATGAEAAVVRTPDVLAWLAIGYAAILIPYCVLLPHVASKARIACAYVLGHIFASTRPDFGPEEHQALASFFPWQSTDVPKFGSEFLQVALNCLILVAMAIYAWASVALGLRACNLTNRGIVSRGTHAWVRHPTYTVKNIAWWIGALPAVGTARALSLHSTAMLKKFRMFSAGLLAVLAAHDAVAQPVPADPAKPATTASRAREIHHWGLKGQSSPHNGWASYGHLTIDLGGDRYFVYDQGSGEFSATVIDRQSETVKIRAISIPGAGLFYFPGEVSPCEPDPVERLGLYAELLLFYLAAAVPAGPASMEGPVSAVVDESVPELRFMQGVMKARQGARTLVTVSGTRDKLQYVLHDDKDNIKGEWEPGRNYGVIPDNESLFGWRSCWAGIWSKAPDGKPSFQQYLESTETLKTFGDVRKALRQKQAAPAR